MEIDTKPSSVHLHPLLLHLFKIFQWCQQRDYYTGKYTKLQQNSSLSIKRTNYTIILLNLDIDSSGANNEIIIPVSLGFIYLFIFIKIDISFLFSLFLFWNLSFMFGLMKIMGNWG